MCKHIGVTFQALSEGDHLAAGGVADWRQRGCAWGGGQKLLGGAPLGWDKGCYNQGSSIILGCFGSFVCNFSVAFITCPQHSAWHLGWNDIICSMKDGSEFPRPALRESLQGMGCCSILEHPLQQEEPFGRFEYWRDILRPWAFQHKPVNWFFDIHDDCQLCNSPYHIQNAWNSCSIIFTYVTYIYLTFTRERKTYLWHLAMGTGLESWGRCVPPHPQAQTGAKWSWRIPEISSAMLMNIDVNDLRQRMVLSVGFLCLTLAIRYNQSQVLSRIYVYRSNLLCRDLYIFDRLRDDVGPWSRWSRFQAEDPHVRTPRRSIVDG